MHANKIDKTKCAKQLYEGKRTSPSGNRTQELKKLTVQHEERVCRASGITWNPSAKCEIKALPHHIKYAFFHFQPETGCSTLSVARANFSLFVYSHHFAAHSLSLYNLWNAFRPIVWVSVCRGSVSCILQLVRISLALTVSHSELPGACVFFRISFRPSLIIPSAFLLLVRMNWECRSVWLYLFAHCKLFVPMSSFPFDLIQFKGMWSHSVSLSHTHSLWCHDCVWAKQWWWFFCRTKECYIFDAWNRNISEFSDDDD